MTSEWQRVRLADVIALDVHTVDVDPSVVYPIVGVLNRGRGLLYRDPMPGSETKYQTLNRIGPGQVVYSRLKAFEGAITVAPADVPEAYASQEFPTFTCGPDLLPAYFALLTTTPGLWDDLQNLSTGMGGRRERVKPADFLTLPLDLPSVGEQRRLVDVVATVDSQGTALASEAQAAWGALSLAREDLLADCPRVRLSELCVINAKLVDPTLDEFADLVHVGVDSIEKDTGRVLSPRTAREDALVSGKYLFQAGDVVYSKIRPGLRKVALPGFRALCSADAYPLTPHTDVPASLLREALLFEAVVEKVTGMSGRTKMPKVNRAELFSVQIPMPPPQRRERVADALAALRATAERLSDEVERLVDFRATLLASLLNRSISIPESYDALLEQGLEVAS